MPRPFFRLALLAAALVSGAAPAFAQTTLDIETEGADLVAFEQKQVAARITAGVGASYNPDYFGSDEYNLGPTGVVRFDYVRLPGGLEFGSSGGVGFLRGFGPRGSARYIGKRDSGDHSDLRGLDDVDASLELGLGLGYDADYWRAFADMRYGVFGHHSWVGEMGADAILRPNDAWVVNFGPRANWGSSHFMDTYFGVSQAEANRRRSNFDDPYDASAGFYSAGVELGARYSFSPHWGVEGTASYERLINDAADSPIVMDGSRNQYGLSVMITRSLSLGF